MERLGQIVPVLLPVLDAGPLASALVLVALLHPPEVPLGVAEFGVEPEVGRAPVVATPTGPALAWALVLRPLDERARVGRVTGTSLEGASVRGREGIESLYVQSLVSRCLLPQLH